MHAIRGALLLLNMGILHECTSLICEFCGLNATNAKSIGQSFALHDAADVLPLLKSTIDRSFLVGSKWDQNKGCFDFGQCSLVFFDVATFALAAVMKGRRGEIGDSSNWYFCLRLLESFASADLVVSFWWMKLDVVGIIFKSTQSTTDNLLCVSRFVNGVCCKSFSCAIGNAKCGTKPNVCFLESCVWQLLLKCRMVHQTTKESVPLKFIRIPGNLVCTIVTRQCNCVSKFVDGCNFKRCEGRMF